jgi:hypothetical protein
MVQALIRAVLRRQCLVNRRLRHRGRIESWLLQLWSCLTRTGALLSTSPYQTCSRHARRRSTEQFLTRSGSARIDYGFSVGASAAVGGWVGGASTRTRVSRSSTTDQLGQLTELARRDRSQLRREMGRAFEVAQTRTTPTAPTQPPARDATERSSSEPNIEPSFFFRL